MKGSASWVELYTPMKYSFMDVGHASRVETLGKASSTHGWELSANRWTCQFDLTKPSTPRAKEKRVQLGIISVAKVSHEVESYSRVAPRGLARTGALGGTYPTSPVEKPGRNPMTPHRGMSLLLSSRILLLYSNRVTATE